MADPTTTIPNNTLSSTNASLSYPGDIQSMPYYTRMTFTKYSRSRPSSTRTDQTTATIILPLPDNFADTSVPRWAGSELGLWGAEIGEMKAAWNSARQTGSNLADQYFSGESMGAALNGLKAAGVIAMALSPKSMRDGAIQNRVSQELGAVTNPHLSLMFEGMSLRNHPLSWKFSPHNEKEAKALGEIINKIRILSLPSYNKVVNKFALDYPDTVTVEFTGVDSKYKTKIFKSAIDSFQTNLAPSGLTFYPSGVPVEIEMTMNLIETEIVTREDFDGTNT